MISLFEKDACGSLTLLPHNLESVFASLDAFQSCMDHAEDAHAFDQLVIIGSGNDIAWIHASLPAPVTRRIVAEIEYPLLAAWFKQPVSLSALTHALEGIFSA